MRSALMDMGAKNRHLSPFNRVTLWRKLHGSPARTSMRPLPSGSGSGSLDREMEIRDKRKDGLSRTCRRRGQYPNLKTSSPENQEQPNHGPMHITWTCPLTQAPTLQPEPTRATKDWPSQGNPRPSHSLHCCGAIHFVSFLSAQLEQPISSRCTGSAAKHG